MTSRITAPAAAVSTIAERVEPIQWLRGIAAMLVVCNHCLLLLNKYSGVPDDAAHQLSVNIALAGAFGVDLFFVISGFVIGLSALQGHARDGLAFRRPFARRRIARIVPLYALTALVFLLLVDPTLLGEPLRVLGRHLVAHALERIQQHLQRGAARPSAQFLTSAPGGQLLRVQMAPVRDIGASPGEVSLNGFVLMLENITRDFANESERDTLLHGSPDTVIRQIERLRAEGTTSIMLHYPPYYGPQRISAMLRLFAKEVLPVVRSWPKPA